MLRHKVVISLTFLISVAIACQSAKPAFQCQDKIGCVTIAPNAPLKIGVMQDLSGGAKLNGLIQSNSVELAVADKPQLWGHPVELVPTDDKCSAEGGANAMLKYSVDPQLLGILGPTCSSAAVEAGKLLAQSGLVLISSSSTSPQLTSVAGQPGQNWQAGFFRTVFNDSFVGRVAAVFVYKKLALHKVAIINDGDAFTLGLSQVFRQAFTELGGVVVVESTVNKGDKDMKPVLNAVVQAQAEAIFLILFHDERLAVYQQAPQVAGLEKTVFLSNFEMLDEDLLKNLTDKSNPLYLVDAAKITTPANQTLAKRYEDKYHGAPDASTNFAYDAANLLFKAIEQVAVKDDDGTLHVGRQALRDALYGMKNFAGMSGNLSCDKFGDCGMGAFNVLQVAYPSKTVDEVRASIVYTYDPQK